MVSSFHLTFLLKGRLMRFVQLPNDNATATAFGRQEMCGGKFLSVIGEWSFVFDFTVSSTHKVSAA